MKIAGKSIEEAIILLSERYLEYIKSPVIDLKIHSHEVTVIGEVINPGNYSIYRGNNSVGYLIGEAGGTDFYAKLNKVTLARGDTTYLLDLTKMTPVQMNRFNLLPGDVLYFPTRRGKAVDKKVPIILATITTLILVLTALSK